MPGRRVWKGFVDSRLQQDIFTVELKYPQYRVSDRWEGDSLIRRIEVTPKLEIPNAAKKIVGSLFRYVEEGELRNEVYRFKFVPPQGVERVTATCHGEIRAEVAGAGATHRIVDLTVKVHMPLVGGMLEGVALQALKEGFAASADALNARLAASQ